MEYQELKLDEKRLFKVAVVSTMSSGKSTLINALAGQELLPSINQACTARILALLDNDSRKSPCAHILYENHTYEKVENCTIDTIRDFNSNLGKSISDIIVECDIAGVHNAKTALLLVDTPGVNNHLDASHGEITFNYLQSMERGLILCVLNATQPFTDDMDRFFSKVIQLVNETPDLQLLFVINKMDELDPQNEDPFGAVKVAAGYLHSRGVKSPAIIPVSSIAALLFKRALTGDALSEHEQDSLLMYYRKYHKDPVGSLDCRSLVWRDEIQSAAEIEIDGDRYSPPLLYQALEQTGIPTLERAIESCMLQTVSVGAPKVKKVKAGEGSAINNTVTGLLRQVALLRLTQLEEKTKEEM